MMSRLLVLVAFALTATAASAQLKPQLQTGSLIPVKPKAVDSERAGEIRKGFARCIYSKHQKLADRLLFNSDPLQIDYAAMGIVAEKFTKEFGLDSCLGHEALDGDLGLTMQPQTLRSMLEEEAYLAKVPSTPGSISADAPVVERNYVTTGDALAKAKAVGSFSDCVVRTNPALADAILRTTPGTKKEMAAARALASSFGACLFQDETLEFTATSIRAYVADGAWQLFVRPGGNVLAVNQ